ncbi:MAG: type II toxin-antitoxin system RelE/ParE family toxin [Paracoccaceae bacterium]|nr:type II toxin-antitoxin system RelE/ParE family toxin [Paracoccaceae bacterium]
MGAFILHGHAVHMRGMIVRSFRHRGLRQLFETDSSRLLKQDLADRVRGILAALAMAETMEGFIREAPPGWRVHRLSGARRYEWSVSVSGNWRITFEERNGGIERVNLEDYL